MSAPTEAPPPETPPTPPEAPTKPGWKTTEFWLKIGAMLLTALFASGAIPTGSTAEKIAAIAATMLGALGYTVARTYAKKGSVLLLLFGLASLPSCATLNPILCGQGQQVVPPSVAACATAFLEAAAGDVVHCLVPESATCIDAILASIGELKACEPTCAPIPTTTRGAGAIVHVSKSIQRTNIIESLKATGRPNAGQ